MVHRDIKPANLLFDADRRLRIADFGLARALAEASWTEPDGAILGTARYSAPEQVEGWVLDGKADVYALALVLYEAVTGEAAFIGDTTVSTLMARVGTLLPEHRALGPLNDVLVWAAAPDPAERYDAPQFGQRLQALAVALPRPDPLPITEAIPGPAGDLDTGAVRPRRPTGLDADPTELGVPSAARHFPGQAGQAVGRTAVPGRTPAAGAVGPGGSAAGVVVAALVAVAGVFATRQELFTPSHPVPSLVGKTTAQADGILAKDKFHLRVTGHASSITLGAGRIVSQTTVPPGRAPPRSPPSRAAPSTRWCRPGRRRWPSRA